MCTERDLEIVRHRRDRTDKAVYDVCKGNVNPAICLHESTNHVLVVDLQIDRERNGIIVEKSHLGEGFTVVIYNPGTGVDDYSFEIKAHFYAREQATQKFYSLSTQLFLNHNVE